MERRCPPAGVSAGGGVRRTQFAAGRPETVERVARSGDTWRVAALGIPASAHIKDVENAAAPHALGQAELIETFQRH